MGGVPEFTHDTVLKGLTLSDSSLSFCILDGSKVVENRSWIISPGWYAIHTGVKKPSTLTAKNLPPGMWAQVASLSVKKCPRGAIAGLAYISHALPLSEVDTPWALGPYCHIISRVGFLEKPIRRKGQLGLWKLTTTERAMIDEQFPRIDFRNTSHDTTFPPNQNALSVARVSELAKRAEKRAEKRASKA